MIDKHIALPDPDWRLNAAAMIRLCVNEETWAWKIDFSLRQSNRAPEPKGLLYFSVSYGAPTDDDWYNVIEVIERVGAPSADDLVSWKYDGGGLPNEEFRVLSIQASGAQLMLVCKRYELVELPDESRFLSATS